MPADTLAPPLLERELYEILGVDRGATEAEIKRAYRRLIMAHHPDKFHGDPEGEAEAHRIVSELNQAYEILGNDERRARYDRDGSVSPSNNTRPTSGAGSYSDFWSSTFYQNFYTVEDEEIELPDIHDFRTTEEVIQFLDSRLPSYVNSPESIQFLQAYLVNLRRAIVFALRRDLRSDPSGTALMDPEVIQRLSVALARFYDRYGRKNGAGLINRINQNWSSQMGSDEAWYAADLAERARRIRTVLDSQLTETIELLTEAVTTVAPAQEATWPILFPGRMTDDRLEVVFREERHLVETARAIRRAHPHNEHLWDRERVLEGLRTPWRETRPITHRDTGGRNPWDFGGSHLAILARLTEAAHVGAQEFPGDEEVETAILDAYFDINWLLYGGVEDHLFWELHKTNERGRSESMGRRLEQAGRRTERTLREIVSRILKSHENPVAELESRLAAAIERKRNWDAADGSHRRDRHEGQIEPPNDLRGLVNELRLQMDLGLNEDPWSFNRFGGSRVLGLLDELDDLFGSCRRTLEGSGAGL